jgi:hypothetical protein
MLRRQGGATLYFKETSYDRRNRYWLTNTAGDSLVDLTEVDWADWDHSGRLVFARKGRLYGTTANDGWQPRLIIDLNDCEFAPKEAPAWARQW